jgi:4-diphosphocytidyl-2-C-methyl-D-erythritol kinase
MIQLRAGAKLTWYLEVTGLREDGYHLINAEMMTLDFADTLNVDESEDYLRLTAPDNEVPLDGTNLVNRALRLVDRRAGVTLNKVIPSGGGLGGGSADAAAILRWAGGVSVEKALTLGADVPFCQQGGRAQVQGVGEIVTALEFDARKVTLILPNFGVNTTDCYRAFDELRSTGWWPNGRNHLEEAAMLAQPRLARTLKWLRAEVGGEVQLAGSGSTMFVEGHLDGPSAEIWGPEGPLRFRQTTTVPA